MLFLAVTAEEQGLLGSGYYSVTPIYPVAKTVADINMDSWNVSGRTKDVTLVGLGASDLDDYVREAAAEQGRVVHGDAEPEKGFYYRSDHFNFAKQGVPALSPEGGVELHREVRRLRREGARGMDGQAVPQARRRGASQLGSHGDQRGSKGLFRGRLSCRPGGQDSGMEAGQRVQSQARRDAANDGLQVSGSGLWPEPGFCSLESNVFRPASIESDTLDPRGVIRKRAGREERRGLRQAIAWQKPRGVHELDPSRPT